jgi:hypothetical protein
VRLQVADPHALRLVHGMGFTSAPWQMLAGTSDITAVVACVGSANTRIGYAGGDMPEVCIQTVSVARGAAATAVCLSGAG